MMPPDPRKIEEWLSGLLDGELSEQEQRELDTAMQNDPSIAQRLEELTSLRRALLQGRSVGRLGTNFSKRIVQAARQRASEMDAPPAWILPDAPNAVAPQPQESDPVWTSDSSWSDEPEDLFRPVAESIDMSKSPLAGVPAITPRGLLGSGNSQSVSGTASDRFKRIWVPSIAIVAALVSLFLLLPRSTPINNDLIPVAQNPSRPDASDTEPSAPRDSIAQTTQKSPTDPNSNPALPSDKTATPEGLPRSEGLIAKGPGQTTAPEKTPTVNPAMVAQADPKTQLANPVEAIKKIALVANISMDSQAVANDALESLLEKYEIIASSDAILNQDEVETLVSSQVLKCGPIDTQSAKEDLRVYVVKASTVRLDSFLREVEKQHEDFPGYHLNVSFDASILKLLDSIVGITDSAQTARQLFFPDLQTGTPSESINLPKSRLQKDRSSRVNANQPNAAKLFKPSQEQGFLILVVRQAE
jgi:hypothetical protein